MHPGVILFCWLCVVIALQVLDLVPLLVLLSAMFVVFAAASRRRWLHLVRRSRWLIVVLALTFLLSTPGESLRPGFPGTWEGLALAGEHGGRFLLILAAVAWLLETCRRDELMAGIYCLLRPLRRLGLAPERAVARLALVFEQIDGGGGRPSWRTLLDEAPVAAAGRIEVRLPDVGGADLAALAAAIGLVVLTLLA